MIEPRSIVTAEWVRMKCQFGCPGYGVRLSCPPYSPTPEVTRRVVDSYEKAILFRQQLDKGRRSKVFNDLLVHLEIELFLEGYYKAWSMGAGPCRLCDECNVGGLCRHGYEMRPSMEACGIDVFQTARGNGFPIEVVRNPVDMRDAYGVVLVE